MLTENTLLGQVNKVSIAIERLRSFEPEEGYYLAFSGGKDSVVIKTLADMARVKYDAHYNLTTVDPPELVKFIRQHHSDVAIDRPELSMWQLIVKKRKPPTRLVRYCCEYLKEHGGENRICITGVRWAESVRRKASRGIAETTHRDKTKRIILLDDNDPKRHLFENCRLKSKQIINPIIDWTDADVWEFIKAEKIPYCCLYDEGFKRLGCIGCPMGGEKNMNREFSRWTTYRTAYIKAFDRMIAKRIEDDLPTQWKTGEEVMAWWITDKRKAGPISDEL